MSAINPNRVSTDEVLSWGGCLDIEKAPQLRLTLMNAFAERPAVILDLSSIERCDVSGLQILLAASKTASAGGKSFLLRAPSQVVLETAAGAGLTLPGTIQAELQGSFSDV